MGALAPMDGDASLACRDVSLWFRIPTAGLLTVNAAISLVEIADFVARRRSAFPGWFAPLFVAAAALFLAVCLVYAHRVWRGGWDFAWRLDHRASWTLILLTFTFLAASSLHQFYPFRPDVLARVGAMPLVLVGSGSRMPLNLAMTAGGFAATALCAILYWRGWHRTAVVGYCLLAAGVLFPNDNCENAFNELWINWCEASPLMFCPNSVALLVGVSGLSGLWPQASLWTLGIISMAVLALGLGHFTGIIW